jgi:hypothetical protein
MQAFKPRHGAPTVPPMKARGPGKLAKRAPSGADRVIPLTGVITLSEKDFSRFETNMKKNPPPKEAARKAAALHTSLAPKLRP